MQYKERLDRRWQREIHQKRITRALHGSNNADAIDMALYNMASKPIARPQGSLEIQFCSFFPTADGGALERGADGSGFEPTGAEFANRQTRPVHGDAVAGHEVAEQSTNSKLAAGVGLPHTVNLTNLLDQSREH